MNERAKITTGHLIRQAIVYLRQSSAAQVEHNRESTERQYALANKARELGWPEERILVIDEDLGLSGSGAVARSGFARLTAEVALAHVGLVLGLEVSRLARNNADWHRLIDLAGLTDTLIGDADGIYHPALFNDRLLLGLKGTMSEAELHVLRARLNGGIRNKAARGELRRGLPVGFVWGEAVCGKVARTVLCGGRSVMSVPTATVPRHGRDGRPGSILALAPINIVSITEVHSRRPVRVTGCLSSRSAGRPLYPKRTFDGKDVAAEKGRGPPLALPKRDQRRASPSIECYMLKFFDTQFGEGANRCGQDPGTRINKLYRERLDLEIDGGLVTSDAGALLLGATDRAIRMMDRFASCFHDERRPEYIEHEVATLVGQRVFGIALGYEDLNDHDELRHDPMMAILAGKLTARREDCAPVAGKSTLNRLELSKLAPTRYHKISHNPVAIKNLLVDLFVEAQEREPRQIILDLDATDDPLHGEQEGRFFHAYYDCYCYLPLYVFSAIRLAIAALARASPA